MRPAKAPGSSCRPSPGAGSSRVTRVEPGGAAGPSWHQAGHSEGYPSSLSPGVLRGNCYTNPMSSHATEADRAAQFVFDWNEVNRKGRITPKNYSFMDETLRDGLQNP